MRSDRLMTGLVLVLIGVAFLLSHFGYVHINWFNLLKLWPIFLVIGGVNLILAQNKAPWATVVKVVVVIAGFSLILFANTGDGYRWNRHNMHFKFDDNDFNMNDDDDDDDSDTVRHGVVKIEGNSKFNEPFNAATKIAKLTIAGGGTSYYLNDTTSQLFSAATKEFIGKYEFSHKTTDSVTTLDFRMRDRDGRTGHNKFEWDTDKDNSATMKLNNLPTWDIAIKTGAAKVDFDLTKFKVRNLTFKGGAAEFDVKLGQPLAVTTVDVSTGVSDINIKVPQNAACSITTSSGLSSNDISGFNKVSDNHYETAGYASAKTKIIIKLSGGISSFNVSRY